MEVFAEDVKSHKLMEEKWPLGVVTVGVHGFGYLFGGCFTHSHCFSFFEFIVFSVV